MLPILAFLVAPFTPAVKAFAPPGAPAPDLRKPSLRGLSYLLRHKGLWPEGFTFCWGEPRQCGMGLAAEYWGGHPSSDDMAKRFGISWEQSKYLFLKIPETEWGVAVTPKHLANHIDRYITEHGL